ncbi:MAG: LysR family transcriptional regulator [Acidobacteriota bacterium]
MDLHQLKVFREAARAGSFTRSSERLHLSQSTISLHIKKLEEEFGVPLFLRTKRRVQLSEGGKRLLPYADRIFQELKNADLAVKAVGDMECGAIRLGSGGTTVTYVLPKVLRAFQARYHRIELIVTTGSTEALAQAVHQQTLDLAIVMQPVPSSLALELLPLLREELVYVIGSDHKLAAKSSLEPGEILEVPMISYLRGSAMQNVIDHYFRAMGVVPRITMEMENNEAIKALVRAGLGAAILPLCCVTGAQKSGIRVLRIRNFPLERNLALALPKANGLPRAVEKFASHLTKALSGKTVVEIRNEKP